MPEVLWIPSPQTVAIAPGVSVPLAPKKTLISKVVLFADQNNAATISIGPNQMSVATGLRPNVAFFQLDAGRDAEIYTDNVMTEFFDLHAMRAAHNDGTNTWFLYVTIYRPSNLGTRDLSSIFS